jgi:hypothetical protein
MSEEEQRLKVYTLKEYTQTNIFGIYSLHCKRLIKTLFDKIELMKIECLVVKRKGNDFVLVASSRINAKTNKNILTVWVYNSNIDIRIMPEPQEHYYEVEELDKCLMDKIQAKYNELNKVVERDE